MEYLNNISEPLKTIDESQIHWISIMERPDLVQGTLRIAAEQVDFTKFPLEAREEIKFYGKSAIGEMENLYKNAAGTRIMLDTDSSNIVIKAALKRKWSYRKMNLYNSSGFDVYEIADGKYVHRTCIAPREGESIFAEKINCRNKPLCIYLPNYNCIENLFVGLDTGTKCEPFLQEKLLPVIFYGHSVTQGAAASRSGNAFPNIVQRKLNRQIINLSASSCCRGLDSMASVIGRLNCHAIVIDYTRNAFNTEIFRRTHLPFYQKIRKYHPEKKMILMTSCNFNHWRDYYEFDKVVRETYCYAREHGENTVLIEVLDLFKEEEYSLTAIDGSHLTDLGMYRVAEVLVDLLKG